MNVLLLIVGLLLPTPQNTTIDGVVTRFGTSEPLGKVEIWLLRDGESPDQAAPETVTDSAGRFTLRDVHPGRYVIEARRGSYITNSLAVSADSPVANVKLALARGGVIAGRALGADGKPFAGRDDTGGIRVSVARVLRDGTLASPLELPTDDRGEYRIYGLEAGWYIVWGEFKWNNLYYKPDPAPRDSWKATYFPGTADREKATFLEVTEDAVLSRIDFTLQQ